MTAGIISKSFQRFLGQPCWGLHHDRQLNLSMNVGKPSVRVREPFITKSKSEAIKRWAARRNVWIRGQWWLWVFCSYWRLSSKGHLLATGSSSSRKITRALVQLQGQKLTSVKVDGKTGATEFAFDLGCLLECRRFEKASEDQLWILYQPNGYVLAVYGNGTYSFGPGSKIDKELIKISL
jgi:hypothetical protein